MTIAEQLRQEGIQLGETRGRQEGIELGETKGRQEGRQDTLKEMAKNMLLNGMDSEAIMKITGLTAKEVASLSH